MNRIISSFMITVIITALFSACGTEKPRTGKNYHTIYFKDKTKSEEVFATFVNTENGKSEEVKMEKTSETGEAFTYSCEGDTSKYNMAYITYDGINSTKFAFNKCVSGWYNSEEGFMPYVEGGNTTYKYKYTDVNFTFNGYSKIVHIWVPDDYNAKSKEKYSTIYLLDGQGADFIDPPEGHSIAESDNATEHIRSMAAVTGKKAIIAAIETDGDQSNYHRDDELIPNLGKMAHEEGTSAKLGSKLADFINGSVVPYMQKQYNVYTDARHTCVQGESLGGLEAFYIATAYPETFGTAGVFSPSFWTFDDAAWKKHLGKKPFTKDSPFLYIYSGGKKTDTGKEATEMVKRLEKMNYPKNKLAFRYIEKGTHDVPCWRGIYAEFLEAAAFGSVKTLQ